MSVLDFLFQGSPPPSVTTYGTATTGVPQYLSDYYQGLLNTSNAIAGAPFQPYQGPRIADFTPDQHAAQVLTRANAGSWQPGFEQAKGALSFAGSFNPANAAQIYIDQALGINPIGMAQGYLGRGAQFGEKAAGQLDHVQNMVQVHTPWESNHFTAAGNMKPQQRGREFLLPASKTFNDPNTVQGYLNPYMTAVVDRIGELGKRNLTENLLPAMGDTFIRAGQVGSTRHVEEMGKALRNTQNEISSAQGNALAQGYNFAGNLFGQDMGRLAQIGQTAGNLSLGEMKNRIDLGESVGRMKLGAMGAYNQLGSTLGNFGLGMTGQFGNMGQVMGNLGLGTMGQYGNLGQLAGNMATITADDYRALGGDWMGFGTNTQARNLTDAAALDAIGAQMQGMNQRHLDLAYNDFVEQRDYPKQMAQFMSSQIRGLPSAGGTTSQTSTAPGTNFQPSGLSQLAGALSLYGALNRMKEGGMVRERGARPSRYVGKPRRPAARREARAEGSPYRKKSSPYRRAG